MGIKKTKVWNMGAISFSTLEEHKEYMRNFADDTKEFNIMRTNMMQDSRLISTEYMINGNLLTVATTFRTEQDLIVYEQSAATSGVVQFLESMGWSVVSEELMVVGV